MKKAQELILNNGSLDEAHRLLKDLGLWLAHLTEPWLLMGVIGLLKGQPDKARHLFLMHQETRKERNGLYDFDPVEISWLSLTSALLGDADLLALTRRESATMRHLSLRRVEWLGEVLVTGGDVSRPPSSVLSASAEDQLSIHWMGQPDMPQWLSLMRRILNANGHGHLLKT